MSDSSKPNIGSVMVIHTSCNYAWLRNIEKTKQKLFKYFGNSPDFWMGVQDEFDLREEIQKIKIELERIQGLLIHIVCKINKT